MNQIGVDGFVGKTDISTLYDLTKRFLIRWVFSHLISIYSLATF
jgi:hypothetical protein